MLNKTSHAGKETETKYVLNENRRVWAQRCSGAETPEDDDVFTDY